MGVETRGAGAGKPSQQLHNWMGGEGMYVCMLVWCLGAGR